MKEIRARRQDKVVPTKISHSRSIAADLSKTAKAGAASVSCPSEKGWTSPPPGRTFVAPWQSGPLWVERSWRVEERRAQSNVRAAVEERRFSAASGREKN